MALAQSAIGPMIREPGSCGRHRRTASRRHGHTPAARVSVRLSDRVVVLIHA
jgi:hypothetical protein